MKLYNYLKILHNLLSIYTLIWIIFYNFAASKN